MLTPRLARHAGALLLALLVGSPACEEEPVYDSTPGCKRTCPDGTNIISSSTTVVDPSQGQFAFISGECETLCAAAELCRLPNVPTVAVDPLTGAVRYSCMPLEGFAALPDDSEVDLSFGSAAPTALEDVLLEVGASPRALAAGDLDGDGDDDLVVANEGSSDASVVASNGDGTFGPERRVALPGKPYAVALADLNDDGLADLLVAHAAAATGDPWALSCALATGTGGFGALATLGTATDTSPPGPVQLVTGGFDSTSGADVIVVGFPAAGETTLFLGDGAGGVGASRPLDECKTGIPAMLNCSALFVGDFDGDPYPDLASVADSQGNTKLAILSGASDGTWTLTTSLHMGFAFDTFVPVHLGEAGVLDAVFTSGSKLAVAFAPLESSTSPTAALLETTCPEAPFESRDAFALGPTRVARLLPRCQRLALWQLDAQPSVAEDAVELPAAPGALAVGRFLPDRLSPVVSLPSAGAAMVVFR